MLNKREQPSLTCNLYIQRVEQIVAIVETDIRKLRHDPYELLTRMIQPAIWLLIFGQAMDRALYPERFIIGSQLCANNFRDVNV